MKRVGGLGKGLSALIPDAYTELINREAEQAKHGEAMDVQAAPIGVLDADKTPGLRLVNLDQIKANPYQPRQKAEEAKIDELAASLKENGLLQPVVVKKTGEDAYEIICGERRVLAARRNGWRQIPAIIKDVADDELIELALVENIQREDLNAIEEAGAYRRLIAERGLSPEAVGEKVGRDRTTITNAVRLLRLPEEVRELIKSGNLTGGHARALLSLPSPEHQRHLARRIVSEELSVRQVEAMAHRASSGKRPAKKSRRLDAEIIDLEHRLSERLGTKVRIFAGKNNRGRLEIAYASLDDLDRILDVVGVPRS